MKNANKEIDILKNNVKSKGKIVKETEKDLYKLDRKYDMSEANLKKLRDALDRGEVEQVLASW